MQQLIQENEELKKQMQLLSQSRLPQQGQQVQPAQDELDTSSWESVPSRIIEKVTPGGTKLPEVPPPIEKGEREPTPPPMPPVPPLPWGNYEVYNEAGVNKWLGPQPAPTESICMMVVIYKASGWCSTGYSRNA